MMMMMECDDIAIQIRQATKDTGTDMSPQDTNRNPLGSHAKPKGTHRHPIGIQQELHVHPPLRGRTSRRGATRSRGPPPWRAGGRGGEPEWRGDGRRRWLIIMINMMMMMVMMMMEVRTLQHKNNTLIDFDKKLFNKEHLLNNYVKSMFADSHILSFFM